MKILLRDKVTKNYLRTRGGRASSPEGALEFCCGAEALAHAVVSGVKALEVVYWFEDTRYNFVLPLRGSPELGAAGQAA